MLIPVLHGVGICGSLNPRFPAAPCWPRALAFPASRLALEAGRAERQWGPAALGGGHRRRERPFGAALKKSYRKLSQGRSGPLFGLLALTPFIATRLGHTRAGGRPSG